MCLTSDRLGIVFCYSTLWVKSFAMCHIPQKMLINKVSLEFLTNSSEKSLAPTHDITFL